FASAANSSLGGYRRSSRKSVSIAWPDSVDTSRSPLYCEIAGTGLTLIGGAPTGKTTRPAMPFTTPAAEAYHATPAVTIPHQPPKWSHHGEPPCERLKKPITSTISVTSSVRKTRNTAIDTRAECMSMYVLKTANANRNQARAFVRSPPE